MFTLPLPERGGIAPTAPLTGQSYGTTSTPTLSQVIGFHGDQRTLWWRVDVLNADRSYKGDITPYVARMQIDHQSSRAVHRTLALDMVETVASQTVTVTGSAITAAGIAYLTDLVQPVALVRTPGGGWLHLPQGVFRFTRPGVTVPGYAVVRHASLPDMSSLVLSNQATDLTNNGVGIPLTLPPGAYVIDVITALLGNATTLIPSNPATLPNLPGCGLAALLPSNVAGAPATNTPGDWPTSTQIDAKIPSGGYQVPEGQSYLDLINHLLFTIGCYDLTCDHSGVFRVQQWPPGQNYTSLPALWTYDTTQDSIIDFGMTEDIMIDNIANVVEVIVEDPSRTTFKAMATNNDPNSPYSIANLGRRQVTTLRDPMVPDVGTSGVNYTQQYAKQHLLMSSWLTDQVTLPIAVNPLHGGGMDQDVVSLNIYQHYVKAGSPQNNAVIVGMNLPGLTSPEKFLVDGWTITAALAQPGSGTSLVGNTGLTTMLESRDQKQGNVMQLVAHRITSTVDPAHVTLS